jgi:hypothetical protein
MEWWIMNGILEIHDRYKEIGIKARKITQGIVSINNKSGTQVVKAYVPLLFAFLALLPCLLLFTLYQFEKVGWLEACC